MGNGRVRPIWPELAVAAAGVALLLMAPIRVSWIGAVAIILSVVSAITTFVLSKQSSKAQVAAMIVGIASIAIGLLIGVNGDGQPAIFSEALIWIAGAGLVMSTFCTLLSRNITDNRRG